MRRSLRWKLLAWYSAIAFSMATLFGGFTYFQVRQATYQNVDRQLLALAKELSSVFFQDSNHTFSLELTDHQLDVFQRDSTQWNYYCVWNQYFHVIDSSHPTLNIPNGTPGQSRIRNSNRELTIEGPYKSRILVGRSIRPELRQLNTLAVTSTIVGVVIVGVMFSGGWFLIGKALEPIDRISRAAAVISESRLTERIDVTAMESELSQLATTINGAFDRLQQAIERQTRFTADASHELRTPLSIIMTHTERMQKTPRSPEEYQEVMAIIHASAKRMQGMVQGLLTLARCDSNAFQDLGESIALNELIEEACDLYQIPAEIKTIRLELNLVAVCVRGNRSLLLEAVGNLVGNAIRYTPNGGHVWVRLTRQEAIAILSVQDNGPGISLHHQSMVFDRFFRVDQVRTSGHQGGIGLGLSIAKSIVEMHKGRIQVISQEGTGTTFEVLLPITHHLAETA